MEKIILNVKGMSCGHCEAAVTAALENLAGVKKAKADSSKGMVAVKFDSEAVSIESMKKAITEAGYDVE